MGCFKWIQEDKDRTLKFQEYQEEYRQTLDQIPSITWLKTIPIVKISIKLAMCRALNILSYIYNKYIKILMSSHLR